MDGVNFKIYVNVSETETPSYKAVAGQKGGKLNRSADTVDTTTKDGAGWKESRAGLLEWSIDGDGVFVHGNEGLKALEKAFLERKVIKVKMGMETGLAYEGNAIITDFPLDMPYDNDVTYSVKLQGTGALEEIQTTPARAVVK